MVRPYRRRRSPRCEVRVLMPNQANRANRATPLPSNLAPTRQVAFQRTHGLGLGANRADRGVGWRNPAPRELDRALQPCDWPWLAMLAGAASLSGVVEHFPWYTLEDPISL